MNKRWFAAACVAACVAAWVMAQNPQEPLPAGAGANPAAREAAGQPGAPGQPAANLPPTDERHYSYAIGLDMGTSFRTNEMKLDLDSLIAGVRDGLSGAQPKYSPELCRAAMQRLGQQQAAGVQKRSQTFLAEHRKQPGVQVLPSGLQYKVLKAGNGPSPTAKDKVRVHYEGKLTDGTVFDSTAGGDPATLEVGRVIKGWTEALQKMKVGDKWQLVIPPELAYGAEGAGDAVPPNATLIFDVELLGIER